MSSGGFGDQFGQGGQYGQVPQFGQPGPYGQPGWQQPGRTNPLAIAALCCGIAQVIAGPFAGIPAIVLGSMSLGQLRRTGEQGRGMAITGIVLGIVGVLLTVLVIVLFIAVWSQVTRQPGFQVPSGP